MSTQKDGVILDDKDDITWSGFEDFSSYEPGTRIASDTYYVTPSDVAFRVNHEAGADFLPDAHITSDGEQHALSVMLGSLDLEVDSNNVNFEFGMALTHIVRKVGLTINSRFEGVRLNFEMLFFRLGSTTPGIPVKITWTLLSEKGDVTYVAPMEPAPVNINIAAVSVKVSAVPSAPVSELPVTLKKVSWLLEDDEASRQ